MTQDIELALEKGKIVGAKKLLQEYYETQDRQEFEAKLRAEYEALDIFEVKLKDKYVDNFGLLFDDVYDLYSAELPDSYPSAENDSIIKAKVDEILTLKLDDGRFTESVLKQDAPTFEEYKKETKVIQEASYVCDECALALDSETCTNNAEHQTRLIPEVTELVRPYAAPETTDRVDAYIKSRYAELRANAYPPMEEYMDALVKGDAEAMEAYKAKCLAVKEKFPK